MISLALATLGSGCSDGKCEKAVDNALGVTRQLVGVYDSNDKVQIIRVPNYQNVTVQSGGSISPRT